MNSNNLELSLIENEIEKIQSKYQLRNGALPSTANNSSSVINMQPVMQNNKVYDYQQLDQRTNQVKSPSVLTFGGQTLANNQCNSSNMSQHPFIANNPDMQQHMTALQEQTLNKQG